MVTRIENFEFEYSFLDNDFECPVQFQGVLYPSLTHAYHAARTDSESMRRRIANCYDFDDLCKLASAMEERKDLQMARLKIMEQLLRDKFLRNRSLRENLLRTGSAEIVKTYPDESNPSNAYWGVIHNRGSNKLGKLLMEIRRNIENGTDIEGWLYTTFEVVTDSLRNPVIILKCYRDGRQLDTSELKNRNFYILGSLEDCNLRMLHPSISRRHAAILHDATLGPIIVDLGSKAGTYLQGHKIRPLVAAPIETDEKLKFGESSREYVIEVDFSSLQRQQDKKRKKLEQEISLLEQLEERSDPALVQKVMNSDASDTLFLGNLSYKTTENSLRELFQDLGNIKKINMPRDYKSDTHRGIAFLTFETVEEAQNACKLDGITFEGRRIRVDFAERTRKRPRSYE
jgi:predicted NAD-dependent protein-ADP-ribosyltransferase YbiA (DUF1768 family)/pSer/pThr/pTyr-binding forkhead associated (FHA) protein